MAALRARPADIASMRAVLAAFSKAAPDAGKLSRTNRVFHATVHEAAHNSYLSETLNNFNDTLALLRGTTFTIKGRWRHELAENCEVVDAIERRDADAAEQAARGNIREALKVRLKVLLDELAQAIPRRLPAEGEGRTDEAAGSDGVADRWP